MRESNNPFLVFLIRYLQAFVILPIFFCVLLLRNKAMGKSFSATCDIFLENLAMLPWLESAPLLSNNPVLTACIIFVVFPLFIVLLCLTAYAILAPFHTLKMRFQRKAKSKINTKDEDKLMSNGQFKIILYLALGLILVVILIGVLLRFFWKPITLSFCLINSFFVLHCDAPLLCFMPW